MNLKYIDCNKSKYKDEIRNLYLNAFPKEERFPFWILKHSIKNNNILNVIIDNGKFVGMEYIVNCDDSFYLMYFAISKESRNKSYGSKVLSDLKKTYKTIFLSIEKPNDDLSSRRKEFYLRNGFYETNKYYIDAGIKYELLCTNKDYKITEELLRKRYSNMSNSKIVRYIIGKTFNMNNIKFIR
ncbi:MAG: GNAT family N-acetyltransferase [Bacilli bacterium]|nr:GNAT family N-acetyltransferase [Bacilli bacterium]